MYCMSVVPYRVLCWHEQCKWLRQECENQHLCLNVFYFPTLMFSFSVFLTLREKGTLKIRGSNDSATKYNTHDLTMLLLNDYFVDLHEIVKQFYLKHDVFVVKPSLVKY